MRTPADPIEPMPASRVLPALEVRGTKSLTLKVPTQSDLIREHSGSENLPEPVS